MSSFTRPLILKHLPKNNTWITNREFTYFVRGEEGEDSITVPKGFPTDLASIPWPISMFIPKSNRGNQAYVLHDFLYNQQTRPKKECDEILLEAMKVLGVNIIKRNIIYCGVRIAVWRNINWGNNV